MSVAHNDADAAQVVAALRDAGFLVDTIAELFGKKLDYRAAIPILVHWLSLTGNPDVKQDIVRALSVKWARHAAPLLLTEFERVDDPSGAGLRWAIGNALEVVAGEEVAEGMLRIATDRRYGKAREMVVLGLGKLKDPRAVDVLMKLLDDDEVVGHAIMALGKLRTSTARSRIKQLLDHPKPWVRKEAKKALARINKREQP